MVYACGVIYKYTYTIYTHIHYFTKNVYVYVYMCMRVYRYTPSVYIHHMYIHYTPKYTHRDTYVQYTYILTRATKPINPHQIQCIYMDIRSTHKYTHRDIHLLNI